MLSKHKDLLYLGGFIILLLWVGTVFRADEVSDFLGITMPSKVRPTPTGSPTAEPSATQSPTANQGELTMPAAQRAKLNSEVFKEMFTVVFMKEPSDHADFGNWVDSLNQGASFEGVYNGLVHSMEYKKLEETEKGTTTRALQIFGEEMAFLEKDQAKPTRFESYRPVVTETDPISPTPTAGFRPNPTPSPADQLTKVQLAMLSENYAKQFVGASVYSLKRALGDEAIVIMDLNNDYKEKLALWYSKWVVHMAARNIDYGLPLRNKPDASFHYKWALENSVDLLKWEVLNRIHRLMNLANQ